MALSGRAHPQWRPVEDRFWEKVHKTDLCWLWTGSKSHGYGQITDAEGRHTNAHRLAYILLVGPVSDDVVIDHLCRNRACVNPDHLEPVTHLENLRRGSQQALKTHCAQGHLWVDENIYIAPNGWRSCRRCRTRRANERQRRRRLAEATTC
jgi:hypothetical protein